LLHATLYPDFFALFFDCMEKKVMFISRNTTILAAVLLAMGLAACTTKKPDTADGTGSAGGQAATGYGAGGAETTSAGTGGGLDSQALGGGANGQGAAGGAAAGNPLSVRIFHFDYDSSDILPDDYNALKAHAQYLSKNAAARAQIGGHTDERGTREYNMALGERRAKAVAAFLTSNGVKTDQIEVVSYGEEKPVTTGESESVWAENRRVELDYTAGKP
jgi:peptidoglycan-associated lipoprotein